MLNARIGSILAVNSEEGYFSSGVLQDISIWMHSARDYVPKLSECLFQQHDLSTYNRQEGSKEITDIVAANRKLTAIVNLFNTNISTHFSSNEEYSGLSLLHISITAGVVVGMITILLCCAFVAFKFRHSECRQRIYQDKDPDKETSTTETNSNNSIFSIRFFGWGSSKQDNLSSPFHSPRDNTKQVHAHTTPTSPSPEKLDPSKGGFTAVTMSDVDQGVYKKYRKIRRAAVFLSDDELEAADHTHETV